MENILKQSAQAIPRIAKDLGLEDEQIRDVGVGGGDGVGHGFCKETARLSEPCRCLGRLGAASRSLARRKKRPK